MQRRTIGYVYFYTGTINDSYAFFSYEQLSKDVEWSKRFSKTHMELPVYAKEQEND